MQRLFIRITAAMCVLLPTLSMSMEGNNAVTMVRMLAQAHSKVRVCSEGSTCKLPTICQALKEKLDSLRAQANVQENDLVSCAINMFNQLNSQDCFNNKMKTYATRLQNARLSIDEADCAYMIEQYIQDHSIQKGCFTQ